MFTTRVMPDDYGLAGGGSRLDSGTRVGAALNHRTVQRLVRMVGRMNLLTEPLENIPG